MSEKFIGYFRLLDACAQRGCPACRCVRESGRLHLDALIYEQVTDADTRRRLRASWGFCNMHAWMLLEIESSYLGAGIIYEDLLGLLVRRVRRLGDRSRAVRFASWLAALGWRRGRPTIAELYRRRDLCPVCANAAEAEDQYLRTLVRRSEEHTSELQSLAYLVCRLLLEKKNNRCRPSRLPDTSYHTLAPRPSDRSWQ